MVDNKANNEITSWRKVGAQHSLNPEEGQLQEAATLPKDPVSTVLDRLVAAVDNVTGKLGTF